MSGTAHWFQYFPDHFMWSQGMIFAIEMAPWGAAALGEIDQKEIKVFTADEGGSEHCQEDNRQIGANFIADWIADHICSPVHLFLPAPRDLVVKIEACDVYRSHDPRVQARRARVPAVFGPIRSRASRGRPGMWAPSTPPWTSSSGW